MIKLLEGGAYLVNGCEIIADQGDALNEVKAKTGKDVSKDSAKQVRQRRNKGTLSKGDTHRLKSVI